MNTENNIQNNINAPTEEYTFTYTVDELKKSYKQMNKLNLRQPILMLLIVIICLIIYNMMDSKGFFNGLSNGVILGMGIMYFALFFKGLHINKKAQKKSLERISTSIYNYKIFQDYLVLTIYKDNEKIREQKIDFRDIEKFFDIGEHIVFQHQSQLYILKKEMLKENSYFLHFTNYRFAPL